jgi:hypothetical protein
MRVFSVTLLLLSHPIRHPHLEMRLTVFLIRQVMRLILLTIRFTTLR